MSDRGQVLTIWSSFFILNFQDLYLTRLPGSRNKIPKGGYVMAEQGPDILSLAKAYDHWVESHGIPVHAGYYIEDLRTLEPVCYQVKALDLKQFARRCRSLPW